MEYFLVVFIKTFFGPSFSLAIQITKILNKEDSNLPYYLHNGDVFLLSYLFPYPKIKKIPSQTIEKIILFQFNPLTLFSAEIPH